MATHPWQYSPIVDICNPQMYIPEPTPGFYSGNTFQFHDPGVGLKWLHNISTERERVRLLRKIICRVYTVYNPGPYADFSTNMPPNGPKWCEFIQALATEVTNLEEAVFYLYVDLPSSNWGPSMEINFVRALGRFSSLRTRLRKLELRGYFPMEWLPYLEKRTGLKVWGTDGQALVYLWKLWTFQELLRGRGVESWVNMLLFVDT